MNGKLLKTHVAPYHKRYTASTHSPRDLKMWMEKYPPKNQREVLIAVSSTQFFSKQDAQDWIKSGGYKDGEITVGESPYEFFKRYELIHPIQCA